MATRPERGPGPGLKQSDAQTVRALVKGAIAGPRFDAAQQERLLTAAADGDSGAHERLLKAHLDWVAGLAEDREGLGLPVGDLFQEGTIGLMAAINLFSRSDSHDFEAFAREQVGSHMDRALAAEADAERQAAMLVQAAEDYERAEIASRLDLGRKATEAELAPKLEWSIERTKAVGEIVAEARRRYDEEILQYLDPDVVAEEGDDEKDRGG